MTGLNDAFIINEETRQNILDNCKTKDERERTDQIIRPILRGRDIKRNSYMWAGLYVLFIPWHFPCHEDGSITGASMKAEELFSEQYGAVHNHLLQFKSRLEKRNQSETGIRYEWYTLQRWGAKYSDDFNKQKIMYSEIVRKPQFYLDNENFVPEATTFILTGEHIDSLVQYLNSSIVAWIFKTYYAGGGLGSEGFRYKKQFLINLPIPRKFDGLLSDDKIMFNYGFSEAEMNFISSEVNSKIE